MNQATLTTVIGAVTAALLAGSQVITHGKIEEVTDNTVAKSVIEVNQQRHDDEILALDARVKLLEQLHVVDKGHIHEEESHGYNSSRTNSGTTKSLQNAEDR